jgi:urease alpha subunit
MGDPNGSIPTGEPTFYRPMFGSLGLASQRTCITFLSRLAHHRGVPEQLGLKRQIEVVQACRSVTKRQMVRNDRLPIIEVDPETYQVRVDGEIATVPPAERLSLAQLHYLV